LARSRSSFSVCRLAGVPRGARRGRRRRADPDGLLTAITFTGLDFTSVFPRLSLFQSTVLIGLLSIVIIFVGKLTLDFVTTITTFATLAIVRTTPWVVIMTMGYLAWLPAAIVLYAAAGNPEAA
jgi:hypothetical protein